MPFCPHCGGPADSLPVPVVETGESEAVILARIDADRAIEVAKIQTRQERDYNETRVGVAEIEGAAKVASAEAEAEVIAAALTPEESPEPEPIVIDAPQVTDVQADDDAPPPADDDHQPHAPSKARGLGFW